MPIRKFPWCRGLSWSHQPLPLSVCVPCALEVTSGMFSQLFCISLCKVPSKAPWRLPLPPALLSRSSLSQDFRGGEPEGGRRGVGPPRPPAPPAPSGPGSLRCQGTLPSTGQRPDTLTSSRPLTTVFPSGPNGHAEPLDPSGASTLCPPALPLPPTPLKTG